MTNKKNNKSTNNGFGSCSYEDSAIEGLKDQISNLERVKIGLLGRIKVLEEDNKRLSLDNKHLQSGINKVVNKCNKKLYNFIYRLKKPYKNKFRSLFLFNQSSSAPKKNEDKINLASWVIDPSRQGIYDYKPAKDCIFYTLHNTLPLIVGYTIRSHELISSINSHGIKAYGVSRLGFPWDKIGVPVHNVSVKDCIDNVTYLRLPTEKKGFGQVSLTEYMQGYFGELLDLAHTYNPSLIHSASNFIGGNVGTKVARILGIPSIYEVRGLWEKSHVAEKPEWRYSDEYDMYKKMETQACHDADAVITITTALKKYLINERGIDGSKILVVPNGVNTSRFVPLERNRNLEKELKLKGKTVIGYAGTFNRYEGLDLLLKASSKLFAQRDDFRILLIGDGRMYDHLKRQSEKRSLRGKVIFTGQVPYENINQYYSLIDIAAFPRRSAEVCELVSPLKPFEAMAMKKSVIASNVEALMESVENGKNGMLFLKDKEDDLARVLQILLDSPSLREKISEEGRSWVVQNRDWNKLTLKIIDLYNELQQAQFTERQ